MIARVWPGVTRAGFITLSFWRSRTAVTAFAGHDIDKTVYYQGGHHAQVHDAAAGS
jgi:hypothetical protein